LQTSRDNIQGLIDSLLELDETMMNYYGETLSAGAEQLSLYTSEMEHLNSVLDHYMSLAEILGLDDVYEMMGNFIGGKVSIAADRMEVAKENYTDLQARKDEIWKTFSQLAPGDDNYDYWAA
jgi:hypothetical protein